MTYEEMIETAAKAAAKYQGVMWDEFSAPDYLDVMNAGFAALRAQGVRLMVIPEPMTPVWAALHSKHSWDEEYVARNTPLMRDFLKEMLVAGEIRPGGGAVSGTCRDCGWARWQERIIGLPPNEFDYMIGNCGLSPVPIAFVDKRISSLSNVDCPCFKPRPEGERDA